MRTQPEEDEMAKSKAHLTAILFVVIPTILACNLSRVTTGVVELPTPLPVVVEVPTEESGDPGPAPTEPFPPPTSAPPPTNVPVPSPTTQQVPWSPCPYANPSRLRAGDRAYVSYDPPLRNRVRAEPSMTAEIIGFIDPGETIEILNGPGCSGNYVWWYVVSEETGLLGWTAEGDTDRYWLMPLR